MCFYEDRIQVQSTCLKSWFKDWKAIIHSGCSVCFSHRQTWGWILLCDNPVSEGLTVSFAPNCPASDVQGLSSQWTGNYRSLLPSLFGRKNKRSAVGARGPANNLWPTCLATRPTNIGRGPMNWRVQRTDQTKSPLELTLTKSLFSARWAPVFVDPLLVYQAQKNVSPDLLSSRSQPTFLSNNFSTVTPESSFPLLAFCSPLPTTNESSASHHVYSSLLRHC